MAEAGHAKWRLLDSILAHFNATINNCTSGQMLKPMGCWNNRCNLTLSQTSQGVRSSYLEITFLHLLCTIPYVWMILITLQLCHPLLLTTSPTSHNSWESFQKSMWDHIAGQNPSLSSYYSWHKVHFFIMAQEAVHAATLFQLAPLDFKLLGDPHLACLFSLPVCLIYFLKGTNMSCWKKKKGVSC